MKTKQRILSVLMILALAASMVAVVAAPAGAISTPTKPTIASGENVIGVASDYTAMSFTTAKALAAADIITWTFPSGTDLPAANMGGGGAHAFTNGLTDNILILTAAAAIPAGTTFTIASDGTNQVTNPTTPGSKTYTVATSTETTAVTSASYTIKGIKVTGGASSTPTKAASGTTMTITGAGFTAGQSLDVKRGATVIASTTVETGGTFTETFSQSAAGNITAVDGANVAYNVVAVTMAPSISLSATSGLVGSKTKITGKHFTAFNNDTLAVTVAGIAVAESPIALTDAATTFTSLSVTIPSTTGGVKQILVTVNAETAKANFTASPQVLTLDPTTSTKGSTVTASLTGYKASETVTISGMGAATLNTVKVGTDGAGSVTFEVPAGATSSSTGASNTITATGGTSAAADTATLKVTSGLMAIDPIKGAVGTSVTITGTGMDANSVFTVIWRDATGDDQVLSTASSNSTGGLTATVEIPAATVGAGTLRLYKGAVDTTNKTFTVTVSSVVVPVSDALATISGKYTKVWAFDSANQEWLLYDTDTAAPSTLTKMTRGQGYWLEVSEAVTLLYAGNSYALVVGWNLIGWLG